MSCLWMRGLALLAVAAGSLMSTAAEARSGQDRKFDTDWRTGVTVAPGAYTWTDQNFEEKKKIIADTAAGQSRACTHYAFLQWPASAGAIDTVRSATKLAYETQGYAIEEKPGAKSGETIWLAAHPERQAVVLWGSTADGTTVYLSCLTAGEPAANPGKLIVVTVLLALGVGALGLGLWLYLRTRALGKASMSWPSTAGTIKTSGVVKYRTKGGPQFKSNATYSYSVNGRSYSGDRIRFGNYAGAQAVADADVARYPPGTSVQVRYDPLDPAKSVLEAGTTGHSVWGLVLAIVGALLVGLTVVLMFID